MDDESCETCTRGRLQPLWLCQVRLVLPRNRQAAAWCVGTRWLRGPQIVLQRLSAPLLVVPEEASKKVDWFEQCRRPEAQQCASTRIELASTRINRGSTTRVWREFKNEIPVEVRHGSAVRPRLNWWAAEKLCGRLLRAEAFLPVPNRLYLALKACRPG